MKLLKVFADTSVTYLIKALPNEIENLIARQTEEQLHENRSNFECWIAEFNIDTFEMLQELIIAEQLKKNCSLGYKQPNLDECLN